MEMKALSSDVTHSNQLSFNLRRPRASCWHEFEFFLQIMNPATIRDLPPFLMVKMRMMSIFLDGALIALEDIR